MSDPPIYEFIDWFADVIADGLAIQATPIPGIEEKPIQCSARRVGYLIHVKIDDFECHVSIIEPSKSKT